MGWDKRENESAKLVNFEGEYKQEDLNEILAYFENLANIANSNVQGNSDQRDHSFLDFITQANNELKAKIGAFDLDQDITVDDRKSKLDACISFINNLYASYDKWTGQFRTNYYDTLPGYTIKQKTEPFLQKLNDEKIKLEAYEINQKFFEKNKRWEEHVNEYKKAYPGAVRNISIASMKDNASRLYEYIKTYLDACSNYKDISDKDLFKLEKLSNAAKSYNVELSRINADMSTEQGSIDMFQGIRKMTSGIKALDSWIKAIENIDLPYGFKDKVFEMVKGKNGVYGDINELLAYSNTISELLENSEVPVEGLDINSIPNPNPEKLQDAKRSFKSDALNVINKLEYSQTSQPKENEEPIDHEHLMALVDEFGEYCATELPGKQGYQDTLDIEGDIYLLEAQEFLKESGKIYPFDENRMDKGSYYARDTISRIDQLVNIQESLKSYIYAILETQRNFSKAGNIDMSRSVSQYGIRFSKYYNAIARDLKNLSELGLKSNLAEKRKADFDALTSHVNFGTYSVNFSKEMDEKEILDAEREAQRAQELKLREEQDRAREEERRQIREEQEHRQEELKRKADELQKQKEDAEKKKQEIAKKQEQLEKKEAQERRDKWEKEERERKAKLAKEEKERKAIEDQRKDIRSKYNSIIVSQGDELEFGENKSSYHSDVEIAIDGLKNILPYVDESTQTIVADLVAMKNKMTVSYFNPELFYEGSSTDAKHELEKHSEQMQLLMGLKDVIQKMEAVYPKLEKPLQNIFAMHAERLTSIYHKAAKDGRFIFEQTSAIEAPGIGNIELFRNEDLNVGSVILDQVKNVEKQKPSKNVEEQNPVKNDNDGIQIDNQENDINIDNDIRIDNVDAPAENAPAENDLKAYILKQVGTAVGQNYTAEDFDDIIANGYVTYGDENVRNNLFSKTEGQDTIDAIKEVMNNGGKVFLNLPDMQYFTIDVNELKMKDSGPVLEIPNAEYNAMNLTVRSIAENVNGTGTSSGDSEEFKEFKRVLNELASENLPRDRETYYSKLGELSMKAIAYGVAKLDQSMNKRRDTRFTEASKFIEAYTAVCEHRKPSNRNMNLNMIASKYIKLRYLNDLKSNNPQLAEKAREMLSDNIKLCKEIKSFAEKNAFRDLFANKTEKELNAFAHKNAYDIKKDIIRQMQQPQVQLNL